MSNIHYGYVHHKNAWGYDQLESVDRHISTTEPAFTIGPLPEVLPDDSKISTLHVFSKMRVYT